MIYGYGIDLAEKLNYCGIIVGAIDFNSVHLAAIRKFKNILYPNIRKMLFEDMFKTMPPRFLVVDYTSEKPFSEELETELNPLFINPNTPYYQKWQYVQPFTFNESTKLSMWQNVSRFQQNGWFKFPEPDPRIKPEIWALIEELISQINQVTSVPTHGQVGLKFPKPRGYDNDLAIALGLMLEGAKKYVGGSNTGNAGISVAYGIDFDSQGSNVLQLNSSSQARLNEILKTAQLGTNQTVKIKSSKDKDWWQK